MARIVTKLSPRPFPKPLDLEELVAPQDIGIPPTVNYAYDPVPNVPPYLCTSPMIFPIRHTKNNDAIRLNTVSLYPHEAGLPYRSSFGVPHGARAWEANFHASVKLLELLAADKSAADVEVDHGITIAKLAKKELRPGIENRIILATSYMFPSANKRKIELIAAAMVYYFIFDGKTLQSSSNCSSSKNANLDLQTR
jgi:NOL1/NOP2/fmu family ribosome biogenesis protein